MFIGFQRQVQHLPSLLACLIHQPCADNQQPRECRLNNLIEIGPALARLEPKHAADGQQALQARKDARRLIRIQQVERQVHKSWPARGEIAVQNLLEDRHELRAHGRRGRRQHGQEALAEACLLLIGYGVLSRSAVFADGPGTRHAVFEVYGR